MKKIFIFLIVLVLSGCTIIKIKDVENQPIQNGVIGAADSIARKTFSEAKTLTPVEDKKP